jgi:hypothetical protein
MRVRDTPTPEEVARVAEGDRFQSMTCLSSCAKSPRFCAVGWDKRVAWCSYTSERAPLAALTHAATIDALARLGVTYCGGDEDGGRLVRLSRGAQDAVGQR